MIAASDVCADDRPRRAALRDTPLNGLDYLEVDEADRHRLHVVFIAKLGALATSLTAANFVITGGRRVRGLKVVDVQVCQPTDREVDDGVTVTVDHIGDFSTYALCVVADDDGRPSTRPHPGFDPVYACIEFSFQAGCPSTMDCTIDTTCPEPPKPTPFIDYLAKDYASFRQVLLDRLALVLPAWNERHEPDLLITLVELLAYEGDRLSYYQDAVATEAYLHTARQRVSIRRHARLVDYLVHEGCNARAWVFVDTSKDTPWMQHDDFFFVTRYPSAPRAGTVLSSGDLRKVPERSYEVYEPLDLPSRHRPRRVLAPADLGRRLLQGSDPVASYVRQSLDPAVVETLEKWGGKGPPPPDLTTGLAGELDRIAHQHALHTVKAFEPYRSTGGARRLLDRPLRGPDVVNLNGLLLEEAFTGELAPPSGMRFLRSHNVITLHTWGERDCCLPRGANAATLVDACLPDTDTAKRSGDKAYSADEDGASPDDHRPRRCLQLHPGDHLLLEEVRDPGTGLAEDADPAHRHVVRLTRVTQTTDPVLGVPLLDVEWAPDDALPFPLCLSARGPAPDCEWLDGISVARGNVVLVDHGRRRLQDLDAVEVDALDQPCDDCQPEDRLVARRYRPVLAEPHLTFSQPLIADAPATATLVQDHHRSLPRVRLRQVPVSPPRLDGPDPLERYRNPVPATAFDPEDLLPSAPLLARLHKAVSVTTAPGPDPLATFLVGLMDEPTRDGLKAYRPPDEPAEELVGGWLNTLNAALDHSDLHDADRFPEATLDEATRQLLADRSLSPELQRLLRRWLLEQALPEALASTPHYVREWVPQPDLLASSGDDRHFVVEMTDDRRAVLRFGDDELGQQPESASRFRATYRVGNGPRGNVGAEAIAFFVQREGVIGGPALTPRNPMAAVGGTEAETLDEARQRAPYAIRRNLARAVTAADYGALAVRDFASRLQGAAAELTWTGSWYEADVTLDPWDLEDSPPSLLRAVKVDLDNYRRMGHALRVAPARYVPLTIVVDVCVKPDHQRAHVRSALGDAFASGLRADGRPGFFHPDNLRFRSSVDVSEIVAVAQAVDGVQWCRVSKLERLGEGDAGEIDAGSLAVASVEIPRVDSRPGFPEDGSITFKMDGGR